MLVQRKRYLGDGVYVELEAGVRLKLTTERGNGLHVIYLEPCVYRALCDYWETATGRRDADAPTDGADSPAAD